MDYGVRELRCFTNKFEGSLVNRDSCEEEWSSFRHFLNDPSNNTKALEAVVNEHCTNPTSSRVFPTMSAMANICRVVPIHTSDVERTFSQLKLVKTRILNRIKKKTLDSLLRIILEGPDLKDFSFEEAFEILANKKNAAFLRAIPKYCTSILLRYPVADYPPCKENYIKKCLALLFFVGGSAPEPPLLHS